MSDQKRELNFDPASLSAKTAAYVGKRPSAAARSFAYLVWLVLFAALASAFWAGAFNLLGRATK
ncbi:MAG TPA: hypothetical protein VFV50_17260 [Bdellovibrionales bacterium]|nr:hypothetical protein [Bdellovibrionales bacterium]